jgi:site-specific recombinase XerC
MGYTTARRTWQHDCEKAGVTATIHRLHHSRPGQLVQAGMQLTTERTVLGHRNIQITMLYTETDESTVKRYLPAYQRRVAKRRLSKRSDPVIYLSNTSEEEKAWHRSSYWWH